MMIDLDRLEQMKKKASKAGDAAVDYTYALLDAAPEMIAELRRLRIEVAENNQMESKADKELEMLKEISSDLKNIKLPPFLQDQTLVKARAIVDEQLIDDKHEWIARLEAELAEARAENAGLRREIEDAIVTLKIASPDIGYLTAYSAVQGVIERFNRALEGGER